MPLKTLGPIGPRAVGERVKNTLTLSREALGPFGPSVKVNSSKHKSAKKFAKNCNSQILSSDYFIILEIPIYGLV
jgi:hypothetical protein